MVGWQSMTFSRVLLGARHRNEKTSYNIYQRLRARAKSTNHK